MIDPSLQTDAQSRALPYDLTMIPPPSLMELGKVFVEGDQRYTNRIYDDTVKRLLALGNWQNGVGNTRYQLDRANHALKHLLIHIHWLETGEYLGEAGENNLAKTAWFCLTQMEIERRERKAHE